MVFNSFSVNILADATILSFFLNKGYCEIFLISANFEINKYLKEPLKIKTLLNYVFKLMKKNHQNFI